MSNAHSVGTNDWELVRPMRRLEDNIKIKLKK
jgi:hypothetical protein